MIDLMNRGLKLAHLRLLDAILQHEQLSAAAATLGISQPAASRLAAEVDRIIGCPCYARAGRGIQLTPEGAALATRARRVMGELDQAGRDLAELRSGLAGRVRLGAVTGPAVAHILPMIRDYRQSDPGIQIDLDVAPSEQLVTRLLAGELDFVLARRPAAASALAEIPLIPEPLSFMVRDGHPLLGRHPLDPSELFTYDWVLPFDQAILRQTVRLWLAAQGLGAPRQVLSTSSFLMTVLTISQTDALAPIATAVAEAFAPLGLRKLSIAGPELAVAPFSHLSLAGTTLPPAAQIFSERLLARFTAAQ